MVPLRHLWGWLRHHHVVLLAPLVFLGFLMGLLPPSPSWGFLWRRSEEALLKTQRYQIPMYVLVQPGQTANQYECHVDFNLCRVWYPKSYFLLFVRTHYNNFNHILGLYKESFIWTWNQGGDVKPELTWELDYLGTKYIIFRNVKVPHYDKRVCKLAIFRG